MAKYALYRTISLRSVSYDVCVKKVPNDERLIKVVQKNLNDIEDLNNKIYVNIDAGLGICNTLQRYQDVQDRYSMVANFTIQLGVDVVYKTYVYKMELVTKQYKHTMRITQCSMKNSDRTEHNETSITIPDLANFRRDFSELLNSLIEEIVTQKKNSFFNAISNASVSQLQKLIRKNSSAVGAQLSRSTNQNGETALLMAIRNGNSEVVDYILNVLKASTVQSGQFLWGNTVYQHCLPLLASILTGKVAIIDIILDVENRTRFTTDVANSILSCSMTRSEKIDVLELLGAEYVLHQSHRLPMIPSANFGTLRYGSWCWYVATNIRYRPEDGGPPIPKPLDLHYSEFARKALDFTVEFSTMEQLDTIFDAQNMWLLVTQSLLVMHRILGRLNPGTNSLFLYHLENYALHHFQLRQFGRVIAVCLFALEPYIPHKNEDSDWWQNSNAEKSIKRIVSQLAVSVKELQNHQPVGIPPEGINIKNLIDVFDFECAFSTRFLRKNTKVNTETIGNPDSSPKVIIDLLVSLIDKLPDMTQEQSFTFHKTLYDFVRVDVRWNQTVGLKEFQEVNVLHLACLLGYDGDLSARPYHLINLLVKLDADVTAFDKNGNTPLHLLAQNVTSADFELSAQVLLKNGVHLDHLNYSGESAKELMVLGKLILAQRGISFRFIETVLNSNVLSLNCLSAQVVSTNKIQFDEQNLPRTLHLVVKRH